MARTGNLIGRQLPLIAGLAIVMCVGGGNPASATTYQFQSKYVDISGNPRTTFRYAFDGAPPAINNAGQVAFGALRSGNQLPDTRGLWRGDGGPLTYLNDNNDYTQQIAMNNLGEVVFMGHANGVDGIFKAAGGAPITIASTLAFSNINNSAMSPTFPNGTADINDSGQVTFNAIPVGGPPQQTVFVSSGGPVFAAGPAGYGEAINNLGVIAVGNSVGNQIIGVPPIGPTTVLATLPAGFDGIGYPEVNDAGDVIVAALQGADLYNFKFEHGVAVPLGRGWISTYDINNAGGIAFVSNAPGAAGLYSGPNLTTDKVIRVGDPLFGSTLTGYSFGHDGLNDLGQVAFFYQLANGRSGIALATPVPEPATLGLATASLATIGVLSLRRSRRARSARFGVE